MLTIGWLGNACFFSRFLVQWLLSERARRSVSPPAFWWLSLLGAGFIAVYTAWRGELVLLVGCLFNAAVAARNLWLMSRARGRLPVAVSTLLALVVAAGLVIANVVRPLPETNSVWLACAVVGQLVWSLRFVVQLWASERAGRSHFPLAFWWVSLVGNLLLLAYAAHRLDAVLVAGFLLGPIVQVRNLMLSGAFGRRPRAPRPPESAVPSSAPMGRGALRQ